MVSKITNPITPLEEVDKINEIIDDTSDVAKNGTYRGVDLTVKFADEITAAGSVTAWLHARCQAGNFTGINPFDYFWDTTVAQTVDGKSVTAGTERKCIIAGVDMYYNSGNPAMPHHLTIFAGVTSSYVVFNPTANNNGSSYNANPWKASKLYAVLNGVDNSATNNIGAVGFDGTGGCYLNTFSTALRNIMVEQYCYLPSRYAASSTYTNNTWYAMNGRGMLFVPSEMEMYGTLLNARTSSLSQYEYESIGPYCQWDIFKTVAGRLAVQTPSFWLSSACGGGSTNVSVYYSYGAATSTATDNAWTRAPLCFHIA